MRSVPFASFDRYCELCKQHMPEGPDACLGELPGVSHACCGHGDTDRAYAVIGGAPNQSCSTIENLVRLDGVDALQFFDLVTDAQRLPGDLPEEDNTTPGRDAMAVQKIDRVYRSVLKRTARTAGQIAEKAGFESGRQISNELGALVGEGSVTRIGNHSGNTRPTYLKVA